MIVAPLRLASPSHSAALSITVPVVMAPMAGVTRQAFRLLCYEQGAGVCVNEMITARGVVVGDDKTVSMMTFATAEPVRAVQLYGTDPATIDVAAGIAIQAFGAELIDLNFGCPVPKVTRKGGGGVLPWKLDLFRAIVRAAVRSADRYGVPVTLKTRIGIDDEHQLMLDAGRIAEDEGVAAVCLHARSVAQAYSGDADWAAIKTLVNALSIPVIGNGDIWEGADALRMMRDTGCAGVEVGRGALGRPWLFADIQDALRGCVATRLPNLGEVCDLLLRHAELNIAAMDELHGMADMRKHALWYLRGFPLGGDLRLALSHVSEFDELRRLLAVLDRDTPYPVAELGKPRGRQGGPRGRVIMPYGWLDDRSGLGLDLGDAELDVSGG
ncbi:MAG: tRNA dihydrouridine synthase DusB [Propionibacteriaceae bacterium]|jgi:nifR3 family TIM-barrel protein|nr:tRNA dihydrouridine synthase DusB [Propionibacteriaceae bacterium]